MGLTPALILKSRREQSVIGSLWSHILKAMVKISSEILAFCPSKVKLMHTVGFLISSALSLPLVSSVLIYAPLFPAKVLKI